MTHPSVSKKTAVQPISNQEDLINVLGELLTPTSNDSRKYAEKRLAAFSRTAQSIGNFLEIISGHPNAGMRQMVTVILKNRIEHFWKKINESHRNLLKRQLLELVVKEQERPVRIALSQAIASVGALEIPKDNWKELAPFLQSCIQSDNASNRELALTIFASLLQTTPESIMPLFDLMVRFFGEGLKDQDEKVRGAAAKAVSALLVGLQDEPQFEKFLSLIDPIIQNLQYYVSLNDSNPEIVDEVFSFLSELVSVPFPQLAQVLPPLVKFMLEIMMNKELEVNLRDRAATVLAFASKYNPNYLIQQEMIPSLIEVSFSVLSEPEDDDIEEELSPFKVASSLLDELCVAIPSKYTFSKCIDLANKCLHSSDPFVKKAGIASLGILSEGCNELMKANIEKFIPVAVQLSSDQNKQVREATIAAVIGFCEFLVPDVLVYHADILPLLITGLDDPHDNVKEKACFALEVVSGTIKKHQIDPVLDILMGKLLSLLQRSTKTLQKVVLSAIAGISRASKESFHRYFDSVINIMKQVSASTDDMYLDLRARAIEATGIIAEGVGVEMFGPHIQYFMERAMENFNLPEGNELIEYSFHFFGNMATILKGDFKQFADSIISITLKNIAALDNIDPFEGEEDDEDETIEYAQSYEVGVLTSAIEEKGAAILALGAFAKALDKDFMPYFDSSAPLLSGHLGYPHPHIRRQVVPAFKAVVCSVLPKPYPQNFNNKKLEKLAKSFMVEMITTMVEDDDAEVVARVCECLASVCRELGPVVLQPVLDPLVETIIALLNKETQCNYSNIENDDEDHDIVLIDAVSDLIDEVARCIGPAFVKQFRLLFPVLVGYMNHAAIDDRVMAVGTLAEVSKALGKESDPFVDEIFNIALRSAEDTHFNAKRNAIFGLGVLAKNSPHKAGPHLKRIVDLAVPVMMEKAHLDEGLVDNACGCIAQLITHHTNSIPLGDILPIFLGALPLREDFLENDTVYGAIFTLLENQNELLMKNLPALLRLFAICLDTLTIADTIRSKMIEALKFLFNAAAAPCREAVGQLEGPLAERIGRALQS